MTQPEILNEILAKITVIENDLKIIKTTLDLPVNISAQQLTELENRIFARLDYAI